VLGQSVEDIMFCKMCHTSFCSEVKFLNSSAIDLSMGFIVFAVFECSEIYTVHAFSGSLLGGDKAVALRSLILASCFFFSSFSFAASDIGRATRFLGFGLAAFVLFFGLALGSAAFAEVDFVVAEPVVFFEAAALPVCPFGRPGLVAKDRRVRGKEGAFGCERSNWERSLLERWIFATRRSCTTRPDAIDDSFKAHRRRSVRPEPARRTVMSTTM
jgi:hypothetical protein